MTQVILKPRPNDRNISTQHIATLLGATYCVRLATLLPRVATCHDMLLFKLCVVVCVFFMQQLWTLYDVVVVWPGSCNNVALGHAHYFDFQLARCRNKLQQGGQRRATCCAQQLWSAAFKCCDRLAGSSKCWAKYVGIWCVEMLLSFGWALKRNKSWQLQHFRITFRHLSICSGSFKLRSPR